MIMQYETHDKSIIMGSLSKDVFKEHTLTNSRLFAGILGLWFCPKFLADRKTINKHIWYCQWIQCNQKEIGLTYD